MRPITPSLPVPINPGLLWSRKEDALSVPVGEIQLCFCPVCGHTINRCYSSDLLYYNSWYEKSLHNRSVYQQYLRPEVDRLIERYRIERKEVFEITSNSGDYSKLLCEIGDNQAVIHQPDIFESTSQGGQKIRLIYLLSHLSKDQLKIHAELVCCQNVLAESTVPRLLLRTIHSAIAEPQKTMGYFEVQNAAKFFETMKLWDLKYTQYSLFSLHSLYALCQNCGFEVKSIREINDGKIISIDVIAAGPDSKRSSTADKEDLERIRRKTADFEMKINSEMIYWQNLFEHSVEGKKRIVLWGGDERGVMAVNMLRLQDKLDMVVDSNMDKFNLFIPGTGFRVQSPAQIQIAKPDVILISNPLHETDIRKMVAAMGQTPQLLIL